jgi:hypothetical protein
MQRIFIALVALSSVASSACAADGMTAGLWDITVTMENIDGSAVTAEMRKGFTAQKPRTLQQCLTADELKPSPEKLAKESGGKCKATSFTLANGKMASATTCTGQGTTLTSTSSGTYGPKNYSFRSVSTVKTPKGDIRTTVLTSGKWIGACAAK